MSTIDILNLNKTKMFEKIRSNLPTESGVTQNLLECKDDLLYAWDSTESNLLVINWRAAILKGFHEVKHQVLIPSTPQIFRVERVVVSIEGSLIALAGPHGLTVLEVPRRWGKSGQFMEGKDSITCRSNNIDSLFFNNNPHIEIRQIRWHPASPSDSHLLVLLSDNTIRVYDNYILRHVWQVGPFPTVHKNNMNGSNALLTPHVLGEYSVDFDIGAAVTMTSSSTDISGEISIENDEFEKVHWPIVVLRENGNIYVLIAGIDTDKPRLQGPLTMRPQTIDNYGLDSCAILLIPSLPPTIVVAESTGKLHHALLLESETSEESFNEVDSSLMIYPSAWTVEVLETVELELGISDPKNTLPSYTCPIYLKRDYVNETRYFAYHTTGLHVITVNFIEELERYLDSEVISDITPFQNFSRAEYIVCTKFNNGNKVNAVLGFALLHMPSGIILLLSSGQVISLNLVTDAKLLSSSPAIAVSKNATGESQSCFNNSSGPSFIEHIQNILKRTVTQPIISLNKSTKLNPQESYELLTQAMEVLRTQYIKKHEQVRSEFLHRLNTIKLRKEQQRKDIEYLEKERDLIRENAHRLAERFEEISENQELLSKKCQDLIRQANTCLPGNTQSEKEFTEEVEKINIQTKGLLNAPLKAKENINKQCYHIQKYTENTRNKPFDLPEKQETAIKDILLQMMTEIEGQIREVKLINGILNL